MQPTLFIAALFAGLVSFAAAAPQNGLTAMQAEVNAIVAKSLLSRNLMKRYDTTGSYECNSVSANKCSESPRKWDPPD
jgi:hypothetical protein